MNSNSKTSIFRRESLERLSSPEQLDQLMQIVSLRSWIPLVSLSSLLLLGILWSIFARIPITATGRGLLIRSSDTSDELIGLIYFSSDEIDRIQAGMPILLMPDAQFGEAGGLLGQVKTIGQPAITTLEAARQAEASDPASLQQQTIEVLAELQPDSSTLSGYRWSTPSSDIKLSPGTRTIARITLKEKAPIAFVFPFLER